MPRQALSHPVTEETIGPDLVALQFAVAVGERLRADPPPTIGHATEVRLYAEEPAKDCSRKSVACTASALGVTDGGETNLHQVTKVSPQQQRTSVAG